MNQEKDVSNLDTAYVDSNESEEDILVHSKVYAATLTKETKNELAKRARELKQQQAIAKKDINSEIASKKNESSAEVQKRKEVTAEVQKAQTELKRIKREIEVFEEMKIGMSDLKHITLILKH